MPTRLQMLAIHRVFKEVSDAEIDAKYAAELGRQPANRSQTLPRSPRPRAAAERPSAAGPPAPEVVDLVSSSPEDCGDAAPAAEAASAGAADKQGEPGIRRISLSCSDDGSAQRRRAQHGKDMLAARTLRHHALGLVRFLATPMTTPTVYKGSGSPLCSTHDHVKTLRSQLSLAA